MVLCLLLNPYSKFLSRWSLCYFAVKIWILNLLNISGLVFFGTPLYERVGTRVGTLLDAVVWTCWYTIGRCMNVLVQYWTLLNSFYFNNSSFLSEFLAHLDLPCIYIHCLTRYQKKLMRKIYPLYAVSVITFFRIQW